MSGVAKGDGERAPGRREASVPVGEDEAIGDLLAGGGDEVDGKPVVGHRSLWLDVGAALTCLRP